MENNTNTKNKAKRYYKEGDMVWSIELKQAVKVVSIDKENLSITFESDDKKIHTDKLWMVDTLKYSAKKELKSKEKKNKSGKVTYFASVEGGKIPTKDEENAGRDAYARLTPINKNGKEVYELFIPQFTLAKIPLGFASYLDKKDLLSLKHERSSIGGTGLINLSGLIDSTYQGEVILQAVPLTSNILITSEVEEKEYDMYSNTYKIPYKNPITQVVIIEQSQAKDVHIDYDELLSKPSKRGKNGWGSTDKK